MPLSDLLGLFTVTDAEALVEDIYTVIRAQGKRSENEAYIYALRPAPEEDVISEAAGFLEDYGWTVVRKTDAAGDWLELSGTPEFKRAMNLSVSGFAPPAVLYTGSEVYADMLGKGFTHKTKVFPLMDSTPLPVEYISPYRLRITLPSTKKGIVSFHVLNELGVEQFVLGQFLIAEQPLYIDYLTNPNVTSGENDQETLIVGAGYTEQTTVTIGEKKADVTFMDSRRLHIVIPTGLPLGGNPVSVYTGDGRRTVKENGIMVLAAINDARITRVRPRKVNRDQLVTLNIEGSNFYTNVTVTLIGGVQHVLSGVTRVSDSLIAVETTFVATSVARGYYDVRVTDSDTPASYTTLAQGLGIGIVDFDEESADRELHDDPSISAVTPRENPVDEGFILYITGENFEPFVKVGISVGPPDAYPVYWFDSTEYVDSRHIKCTYIKNSAEEGQMHYLIVYSPSKRKTFSLRIPNDVFLDTGYFTFTERARHGHSPDDNPLNPFD